MLNAEAFAEIDTPSIIIDEAIALDNISSFQKHCDDAGLKLRPHIKTHKMVHFAKAQISAGAAGINCQKIGEAEIMAEAGFDDILITFNIWGNDKRNRLKKLSQQVARLSVTVDSIDVIEGLARTFPDSDHRLDVLVECDTGAKRCGVQTPRQALELAEMVVSQPGLNFKGLMTYMAIGGAEDAASFFKQTVSLLDEKGIECAIVSTGGSPDMWRAKTHEIFNEYRIGTYIYNDRSLVARKTCQWDNCALGILATVVSTPAEGRAVIDAGSKSLTSDLNGLDGYGHVLGSRNTRVDNLSEEHGVLHHGPEDQYKIGDRIIIIPNHVCVVSNLFDHAWMLDSSSHLKKMPVDARGLVW